MEELPLEVEFEDRESKNSELPIGKIIAAAVIILVIVSAYFALNYYLEASHATLYIRVQDTHKRPIVNSRIDIFGSNGTAHTEMGSSNYTFRLETGVYKITVTSPGYVRKQMEVKLVRNEEIVATLRKKIFMKLAGAELPKAVICPGKKYGTVRVSNLSKNDSSASISFDGFSGLKLSLIPGTLLVPAGQNATATIEIACDKALGKKEVSGSISLKGSEDKNYFTITILPVPSIDFAQKFSIRADENESKVISIVFRNMESFKVDGLSLKIEGVKDINTGMELKGIVSFERHSSVLEKNFSLWPDGTEKIHVYIKGTSAKAKATLLLYAYFYPKPKEITININSKAG